MHVINIPMVNDDTPGLTYVSESHFLGDFSLACSCGFVVLMGIAGLGPVIPLMVQLYLLGDM